MLKLTLRLINAVEVLFMLTNEPYCKVLPINCIIIVITYYVFSKAEVTFIYVRICEEFI